MRNRLFSNALGRVTLAPLMALFIALAVACSGGDSATPTPSLNQTFADVPGIVDPANFGWPRVVETSEGRVELSGPPQRVFSLSLGHSEILAALTGVDRLVAVTDFYKDPTVSAAWEQFDPLPVSGSSAEEIISHSPDLVIASTFTQQALTDQIKGFAVPVVRTDLENSALGNIPNILFLGYVLGAEDRAVELVSEVRDRVEAVRERVAKSGDAPQRVLAMSRYVDIYMAGDNTTEGEIIEAAGGINAAASAGVSSHQATGFEGIAAINPDIILLTQPEDSANGLAAEMYAEPALADVPAVRNHLVLYSDPTFYTTLSHWNVRGIEETAKLLYPEQFEGVTFAGFKSP
jgi:iron complex transport system substrate-binding protein